MPFCIEIVFYYVLSSVVLYNEWVFLSMKLNGDGGSCV